MTIEIMKDCERRDKSDIQHSRRRRQRRRGVFIWAASYRKIYRFIYCIKNNNILPTVLNCLTLDLIFVTVREGLCHKIAISSLLCIVCSVIFCCHCAAICRTSMEVVKIAISKLMYQQHINKLFHFELTLYLSLSFPCSPSLSIRMYFQNYFIQ